MARLQRPNMIMQTLLTTAIGASDATTLFDLTVPCDNASLIMVQATQKTAGTGAGTFSIQVMTGAADAGTTAVGSASTATFITAAAAAGTVHGSFFPQSQGLNLVGGQHLAIKTVKTGTVSAGAVLILNLFWQC